MAANNDDKLPAELLSQIFGYVTDDCRHEFIGNCREVCRTWERASSEYLINTVVIADRLEALQKACWVAHHPVFSKNVDRLVFDRSSFDNKRASKWQAYENWSQAMTDGGAEVAASDEAGIAELLESTDKYVPPNLGLEPQYAAAPGDDADYDIPESRRHVLMQTELRQKRLALRVMHLLFLNLPKLKHVSYTDYRALTRGGEYQEDLLFRLFGDATSPTTLFDGGPEFVGDPSIAITLWSGVREFLRNLLFINPKLETLSFGRPDAAGVYAYNSHDQFRATLMNFGTSTTINDPSAWRQMLSTIRSLRLPVDLRGNCNNVPGVRRMLLCATPTLTHLELVATQSDWRDDTDNSSILGKILETQHFPCLHTLKLNSWSFEWSEVEVFLAAHAATLRQLHILNCHCGGKSENITRPVGLDLKGAEVYGLYFEGDSKKEQVDPWYWAHGINKYHHNAPWRPDIEFLLLDGVENQIQRRVWLF